MSSSATRPGHGFHCPRCQSLNVRNRQSVLSGMGYVRESECLACGFVGSDAAFEAKHGTLSPVEKQILNEARRDVQPPSPPPSRFVVLSAAAAVLAALLGLDLAFGFFAVPSLYLFAALVAASVLAILAWVAAVDGTKKPAGQAVPGKSKRARKKQTGSKKRA